MFVVKTVLIAGILATVLSGGFLAIWGITDLWDAPVIHVLLLMAALGISAMIYLMHKR